MNNHGESVQKGATPHCDKCQIKMSWVGNSKIHVQLFTKAPFPCEQCDSSVEANNLSTCVTVRNKLKYHKKGCTDI